MRTELSNYKAYLEQIERMHRKYLTKGKVHNTIQGGVPFSRISMRRRSFAKTLAKEVIRGEYKFRTVRRCRIPKNNKPNKFRVIYLLAISDLVVQGVLGELLAKWSTPYRSTAVYSYQRGVSWWDPLSNFSTYIRDHVSTTHDVRKRGLYVFRGDVKEYTDSIPVGNRSPLWPAIAQICDSGCESSEESSKVYRMIVDALRPTVIEGSGSPFSNLFGIPTGSPISTVVANLYLRPLDMHLASIPGAFYARYGDDFIFAHPDGAVFQDVESGIVPVVERLGLTISSEKIERLFFNGAGRASASHPQYKGTTQIQFLGSRIGFDATIAIQHKSIRQLTRLVRHRIRNARGILQGMPLEARGRALCQVVNKLIEPGSPFSHAIAPYLERSVTSRESLRQIDYRIALMVAESLSGVRGVRAFRTVPYQSLRSKWGLLSLVDQRNTST